MARFFKPTDLLDRFYEIGLFIKGFDGVVELIGGVLLLVLSSGTILRITDSITHSELGEDPHNFLALHTQHVGQQLAQGHNGFAALFLLTHGAVKVGLVICLLLNRLWAYPLGLVLLGLLLIYQLYQLIVGPSAGMAFLTVLDVIIIWLVWREWQKVKARNHTPEAAE